MMDKFAATIIGAILGGISYHFHDKALQTKKIECEIYYKEAKTFTKAHEEWSKQTPTTTLVSISTMHFKKDVFDQAMNVLEFCDSPTHLIDARDCKETYQNWKQCVKNFQLDYHDN